MALLSFHLWRHAAIPRSNTSHHFNYIFASSIRLFGPHVRSFSVSSDDDYGHFYRYDSGRWLWDEETRLQERYKRFNVSELKRIAAKSVGAHTCVSISKPAEGGSNKIFRLVMNDGSTVIARIPNPNAGPAFKTTASEVATMDFVC
jgi:hypothetical protein